MGSGNPRTISLFLVADTHVLLLFLNDNTSLLWLLAIFSTTMKSTSKIRLRFFFSQMVMSWLELHCD